MSSIQSDDHSRSRESADPTNGNILGEPSKKLKIQDKGVTGSPEERPDADLRRNDLDEDRKNLEKSLKVEHGEGLGAGNPGQEGLSFKSRAPAAQQQPRQAMPSFDYEPDKDYRKEYHRIYLANVALMDMINQTMEENNSMRTKISYLKSEKSSKIKTEANQDDASDSNNDSGSEDFSSNRKRKRRRKKEEIKRDFVCSVPDCGKSYG